MATEREQCQETCNNQLTGNVPSDQFTMHFDLENNVKKQKKDEEELKKVYFISFILILENARVAEEVVPRYLKRVKGIGCQRRC